MKKILYWTDFFLPHVGGIEIFSASLIPGLQARGYQIAVVTSSEGDDLPDLEVDKTISVHRFAFWSALNHRDLKQQILLKQQIAKFKQDFQPDLIHIHFGATTYFYLQTINAYPAPTLTTIHACPEGSLSSQSLLSTTIRSTQWLNTVSAHQLSNIHKFDPALATRSSLIYCGIELPELPPKPLNIDTPKLLCFGRLIPNKGFDIALQALYLLIKKFPKLRLIIAGDGTAKADLIQQSIDLGLADVVDFRGWVESMEIPALLNESTIVLLPSLQMEGLPLVAIQAAQMARPIVATTVNGIPELIVDQQTGLLVEPGDSVGLAEAVTWFLEHPILAAKMGQAARQKSQENFDLNNCIDQYDILYQKIIKMAVDNH